MISTSTTQPHRFTPAWRTGDDAPVFLIRAGSILERGALEAELAGDHQAGRVFAFELLAAFQAGVIALLDDEADRQQLIELALTEAALEGDEKLEAADAQILAQARTELGQFWPEYRALIARIERRKELAPLVAFRRFCVGVENLDVDFKRGMGGQVTDATLGRLDPLELMAAGNYAFALLYNSEPLRSFPQPSKSGDSPAAFAFGRSIDGGGWAIDGEAWPENPRLILPAWLWPVVDLWLLGRRYASPMTGAAPLPTGGAPGDQPAALMDAFSILDMLSDRGKSG